MRWALAGLALSLLCAAAAFFLYPPLRCMQFGFDLRMFRGDAVPMVGMEMLPAVTAAGVYWAACWIGQWRAIRRAGGPCCRTCGYPTRGLTSDICPECGQSSTHGRLPRPARRLFWLGLLCGAAGALGMAACETWISLDETKFVQEAQVPIGTPGYYHRTRAFPGQLWTLYYDHGRVSCSEHY